MNHRRARVDHWLTDRIGAVILALALLTALYLAYNSYQDRQDASEDRRRADCQSNYNQAVSVSIRERSKYADEDRESLVTFIRKVSTAKTREESRDALSEYLKRQDEISDARKRHPVPALPPGRCK